MDIDVTGSLTKSVIGAALKSTIKGDLDEDVAAEAIKLTAMAQSPSLRDQALSMGSNFLLGEAVDKIASNSSIAGAVASEVIDHVKFQMAHMGAIKHMAENDVPGYGYMEGDFNNDGKMDKVWVDATACLKDPSAEPVYYVDDNIKNLQAISRKPGHHIKRVVPDDPEVVAQATALAAKTQAELHEFELEAEMNGEKPEEALEARLKETAESPKPEDNSIVMTNNSTFDVPSGPS